MRKNYRKDTIEYERVVVALWSERLHANSICPLNHHLSYDNGWFYFDEDKPFQWPELTRKARAMYESGVRTSGRGVLDYPEDFGEDDAYAEYQHEEHRKAIRRRKEEQLRQRQIDEINREFSGTERIMALEWAGYL